MERCLLRTGLAMGEANTEKEIFQTPGYVAIHMMYGYARIIPLDGRPHVGSAIRQWNGDSRGHWEGDTLVVETTNFNDKQDGGALKPSHGGLFGYNHAHNYPGTGETLRLIERFRRLDADTIEYRYTIDDPKVFMAPWTAVNTWSADDKQDQQYEYTCHEHNYGMVNLLKGGRVQEQISLDEAAREVRERQGQLKAAQEKLKSWQEAHGR
jgi:hypothetical protein